jgi:serine phosphatase RsbU (regulator of sigma subunit)
MRLSPNNRRTRLALSLAVALPVIVTTTSVQASSLVPVEASPPAVAKVEGSSIPAVEVPQLPQVQTTSVPTTSTPTTSTPTTSVPVLGPQGSPAPVGEATASAAAGAAPHASPSATSATAGSTAASTVLTGAAQSARAPGRSHRGTTGSRSGRHSAAQPSVGGLLAGGSASTALGASSPGAALRRAALRSPRHKASASNPLAAIGRYIPFPVPVPDWSKPIILALLLLAVALAARSRLAGARARRLERQRTTLLADLNVMQSALVPVIPPRLGELGVSVAYRPADGPGAGGDFYDLFALAPGRVAIIVGDVAGHGHDALTQAALTRYTLRAYMQAGMEPRAALALAGAVLVDPGEKQFATVVIGVHDSVAGRLTYASAGHPPPIAIGFDTPEPLTICCSAPISCGLPTGRRQTTISIPAGGEVCFFSDGLLEARTDDGLLGRERLIEILHELGPRPAGAALLERVRADAQATPDDMLACIISPEVAGAAPTHVVEELEVDIEMLDGSHVGPFLEACGVRSASVAALLTRARRIAVGDGTALLRVTRPRSGEATAAVLRGISSAGWTPTLGQLPGEHALALPAVPTGR